VEARHGTKALQASKVKLFEVCALKKSSICVNNFFQSTKNRSAAEVRQVCKMKVEPGSIWDVVCNLSVALPSVEVQIACSPMKASDRPEKRPRLALLDKLPTIGTSRQWPTVPPIAEVDIGSMVQVKSFQEKYILGDILGTGAFGVVFGALEAHSGAGMAVKVEVSEGGEASVPEVGGSHSDSTVLAICATPHPISTNPTQTTPQTQQ